MKRFEQYINEDYELWRDTLSKDKEMIFDITSRILDEFPVSVLLKGSNGFDIDVESGDIDKFFLNPMSGNNFSIIILMKRDQMNPVFLAELHTFFSDEVHRFIEDLGYNFNKVLYDYASVSFFYSKLSKSEYDAI